MCEYEISKSSLAIYVVENFFILFVDLDAIASLRERERKNG